MKNGAIPILTPPFSHFPQQKTPQQPSIRTPPFLAFALFTPRSLYLCTAPSTPSRLPRFALSPLRFAPHPSPVFALHAPRLSRPSRFPLAENANRGPDCKENAPVWQKTPLGGLAAAFSSLAGGKRDYGASRSISKSQKKLEKGRRNAKSVRKAANGAPNAILGPCSEAPWRRFLPSCEQNRATAASRKEKPVKRYEHLTGIHPDPLSTRCFCPKGIANAINRRLRIHPRTPLQNTASTWHYGFFIKPQSPCWATPFPWTMGTWGDRMVAVQGDRPCTLPGLQTIRRGRNVPTRSQRNRRNRALEGD